MAPSRPVNLYPPFTRLWRAGGPNHEPFPHPHPSITPLLQVPLPLNSLKYLRYIQVFKALYRKNFFLHHPEQDSTQAQATTDAPEAPYGPLKELLQKHFPQNSGPAPNSEGRASARPLQGRAPHPAAAAVCMECGASPARLSCTESASRHWAGSRPVAGDLCRFLPPADCRKLPPSTMNREPGTLNHERSSPSLHHSKPQPIRPNPTKSDQFFSRELHF